VPGLIAGTSVTTDGSIVGPISGVNRDRPRCFHSSSILMAATLSATGAAFDLLEDGQLVQMYLLPCRCGAHRSMRIDRDGQSAEESR
jgi:hypothetical protein